MNKAKRKNPQTPPETLRAAAAIWDDPRETLAQIEARIHDGVPREKLAERADAYINTLFSLFPYVTIPLNGVALEIGSGVGTIMEALNRALIARATPPASILGLDISHTMIERAKERLGTRAPYRFLPYDGIDVPMPEASCDLILSVATLSFIPKPFAYNLLFEVKRVLKPGGFAVLQFLSFRHLPEQETHTPWREEIRRQITGEKAHWHHFYAREELEMVLGTGTGFPYVDIRELGGSYWACVHLAPVPLPLDFDPEGYLSLNEDVRAAGVDPARHWQEYGYREGRSWR